MQEQVTTDGGEELQIKQSEPSGGFQENQLTHSLVLSFYLLEANLVAPTVGVVDSYSGGRGKSPFIPVIFLSHTDDHGLQTIVLYVF